MSSLVSSIHSFKNYAILSIAFAMPFAPRILPWLIIILSAIWIVELIVTKRLVFEKRLVPWALALFYVVHLLGMIYTENIQEGVIDLKVKFSFLLLPVIFLLNAVSKKPDRINVVRWFVYGLIFSMLICFSHSTYGYITNDLETWPRFISKLVHFYGLYFSFILHPGFYATYLVTGILFLYWLKDEGELQVMKPYFYLVIFFMVLSVWLTASKSGLLLLIIIFCIRFVFRIKALSRREASLWISMIILIPTLVVTLGQSSPTYQRVVSSFEKFQSDNPSVRSSTGARLRIWEISLDLGREHWLLGTGTGDVKIELSKRYKAQGMKKAVSANLNNHSQYFQTWNALGILGLLSLLSIFVALFFSLNGQGFVKWFAILIAISCLTESFLEVQAGTVYFSFFFCILISQAFKEESRT